MWISLCAKLDSTKIDLALQTSGDMSSFVHYIGNFNRLFDSVGTDERLKKWVKLLFTSTFQ